MAQIEHFVKDTNIKAPFAFPTLLCSSCFSTQFSDQFKSPFDALTFCNGVCTGLSQKQYSIIKSTSVALDMKTKILPQILTQAICNISPTYSVITVRNCSSLNFFIDILILWGQWCIPQVCEACLVGSINQWRPNDLHIIFVLCEFPMASHIPYSRIQGKRIKVPCCISTAFFSPSWPDFMTTCGVMSLPMIPQTTILIQLDYPSF